MRVDKEKLTLAMARACMNSSDIVQKADIPAQTVLNALNGRNVTPRTFGKVAKALGVDVTEIMAKERENV